MTYVAPGPVSHSTVLAISSVVPYRWSGTCDLIVSFCSSLSTAVMSVSMKPGATTLAVIEREPSSRAIERAMPTRPALEAA